MRLLRPLMAALMVGVLFGGQTTTTCVAATKSKSKGIPVLSNMVNNTKNFVSGIFGGKKATTKKKSSK